MSALSLSLSYRLVVLDDEGHMLKNSRRMVKALGGKKGIDRLAKAMVRAARDKVLSPSYMSFLDTR